MAKTAQQWQAQAVAETGGESANAQFEFGFVYGTSGGTVRFEFNGLPTADIAYPVSSADLKAAFEAVASVGADGCKLTGQVGGPYLLEMTGANAGQDVSTPFCDGSQLEPPQEVEVGVIQKGDSTDWFSSAVEIWNDATGYVSDLHRFYMTKLGLIDLRLGKLTEAVDISTGQMNRIDRKESQRVSTLERMRDRAYNDMQIELRAQKAGSRAASGGLMTHTVPTNPRCIRSPFSPRRFW